MPITAEVPRQTIGPVAAAGPKKTIGPVAAAVPKKTIGPVAAIIMIHGPAITIVGEAVKAVIDEA